MRSLAAPIALLMGMVTPAAAQFSELKSILPRGGQRGTEVEVRLKGTHLEGARDLIIEPGGIEVRSLEVNEKGRVDAVLAIAPDAELGPRAVWVRTATGITNLRTFSIGAFPEVKESEPNGTAEEAQPVSVETTINGIAQNEDVDLFVFEGVSGDRISIEIEGQRLGDRLFDPAVALLDQRGFVIASNDDSALGRQDPVLSVVLSESGPYTIQVRESAYRGADDCRYRLHLGRFVRPAATLPLGGRPGEVLALQLLDSNGSAGEATVLVPTARARGGWVPEGVAAVPVRVSGTEAPSPTWLRSVDLDNVLEVEEQEATAFHAPVALNGVLASANEEDRYSFSGKKGDRLVATAYARRLRTPVDAVIHLRQGDGKWLAGNDDNAGGPDSRLDINLPHDGDFLLCVRDHLGRSGPDFAYRIEVTRPSRRMGVSLVGERPQFSVPQGGSTVVDLSFDREGFEGPLAVEMEGLPPGVSLNIPEVPAGVSTMPALLTADDHAPSTHAMTRVRARATNPDTDVSGDLRVDVELVRGQNNVVFWAHTLDRLPIAVGAPAPFRVRLEQPSIPLIRNGSMSVVALIERDEGFEGEVRLYLPFLPPNVNSVREIKVPAGSERAELRLSARGNAALGDWPLLVKAEADTPGGRVAIGTEFVTLKVAEKFLELTVQPVALEQDSEGELFLEIRRLEGYPGAARLQLVGLPHDARADEVVLDKETATGVMALKVGAKSPAGTHKGLQFRALFDLPGGLVVQALSAPELRIQKPAPAVAKKPAPKKPVEASAEPKRERPPTRLEKLRAEHAARVASESAEDGDGSGAGDAVEEEGEER